ncbi:helix-turn-helix domain-containing protein [Shewanella sp. SR43-4]|jgi:transposase-like protein|uniref:helix-turn-helix domain-containing protein n=1 Tax=Shewanella TaxID=22 RepID=UPI000F4EDDDE|nr:MULTISPECIES: helix-turn-helix domain-containing protein [Shewanella]MBB1318234.1 helix-turn-helix domain-containing protein [Shewanella sp. SR43-4]MBB1320090.1 helix-turn-helix domain-containing protein [Shewanella sp. SR43-8]MBB1477424.1 helix-turn-helix domain-containing protein [Shewanella sp. SG41-3]RPA50798.1 DNA-binding protein [Shewanella vesiculosa]UJL44217.1 helix-turn-helix domain-containing protein [Shewanella vesiculosa]|tara:strand:+ start:2808 stop:3689 length:882 start_codon:yes stop_codon:yes gene_type:complete
MTKKITTHLAPELLKSKPRPKSVYHRNATTTPEMRQFIQQSDYSVSQLSKILNISEATVRKWRKRDSIDNTPNTPHKLNTTLSPMEEYVMLGLRYQLKMPLDRLLKVTQEFINPNVSRSGLARCLKRFGVSKLDEFDTPFVPEKFFNQLPITQGADIQTYTVNPQTLADTLALPSPDPDNVVQVVSLSIPPQLTKQQAYSVLLGVDFKSDWVYLDIYQDSHTQASNRYITHVLKHGPFHLRKLLVRNYHTFLARFPGASQPAAVSTSTIDAAGSQHQITEPQLSNGDSYEPIQ